MLFWKAGIGPEPGSIYNHSMDEEVRNLINKEEQRQAETITLIPSENYTSREVRDAVGSVLAEKYAEGYPGRRYYQGNGIIDEIEQLAIDRVKKLFGVPYANVQPYSGSPANAAVLLALMAPGETLMGLKLTAGGHLTHGHPGVTFSGRFYQSVQYDVDEEGWIDYEEVTALARKIKPKLIIAGTTAYPRVLEWSKFRQAADLVDAYLLADISHIAGLVIVGEHESPVDYADVVMTTTHKTLRGPRGAILMATERGLKKDPELAVKIGRAVFPGLQGGPHENTIAGIAVALGEDMKPEFKEYVQQVLANAKALAEELTARGYELVTGGTDNHLMIINLRNNKISGKQAAMVLEEAGLVTNANSAPGDSGTSTEWSGVRLGTPAVTTRGMKETEMKKIADWINMVLQDGSQAEQISAQVRELCRNFPIPR